LASFCNKPVDARPIGFELQKLTRFQTDWLRFAKASQAGLIGFVL